MRLPGPPAHTEPRYRVWWYALRVFVALVCVFLVAPIISIIPLSFSSGSFLSYPVPGFSLKWYAEVFAPRPWMFALKNSLIVGAGATVLATTLGTLAAIGLARGRLPGREAITGFLISPMVVPLIITGVGVYFFFAELGLNASYPGLILAHSVLAVPFVVITVTATLEGFDPTLVRAAQSLGAGPLTTFRKVTLPLISPGVASGAVFAFAISFDEVVVTVFVAGPAQRTLPREMFAGLRENISPAILAVATLLVVIALLLMVTVALLKRRSDRLRGLAGS
jgi:putative spermidine/putrescine transport system permease protein